VGEIIVADRLCRSFPSGSETVHALKEVSLTVRERELTVLRGPSGSGKTTLINLLGALDLPTSGSIRFMGEEISALGEAKRDALRRSRMGFVFQTIGLISHMSAFENVDFALRISGFPAAERAEWADHCLHLVGMSKRRDHRPFELSGGEQQRVAIARAVSNRPRIIFADEPTSALDTHLGLQVVRLFRDLVRDEGMTVLMTTHDPNLMEIADGIWSLRDGSLAKGDGDD